MKHNSIWQVMAFKNVLWPAAMSDIYSTKMPKGHPDTNLGNNSHGKKNAFKTLMSVCTNQHLPPI